MDAYGEALLQRIALAREELRTARRAGDLDAERIYAGELDSLTRQAADNNIAVPPDSSAT
ncbi:hypothetical protein [Kribbella sp. NPDC048915]|uniref:hypothetical protein n=1 Tax=Kribbella sp. NPDC048915 TaxID=3155148 RepID=UPI0033CB4515